ncbi:MAG: class I SAM-dependent rRNA methyltransferase [Bacteroidales bacterium]|nr:class I SAM-dependent rRNA methyltransferase [Bacteroidales bacterium]
MAKIYLKKGREESVLRFHPWVFSGAVAQCTGDPAEGDLVDVYSSEGVYLGCGHYQIGSIAVRLLSFCADPKAPDFWELSLRRALDTRMALGLSLSGGSTDCFRLVHGEGDSLPGLIIDYYAGVCVIQAHSAGMFRAKKRICEALKTVLGDNLKAVYDKSAATAPFKAGLDLIDGYLWRADSFQESEIAVSENGVRFMVDWEGGQKTGFFLDQRENRKLVGSLSAGRRVLNLFCYTGGFSLYARAGGAASVTSVDSSARAMAMLARNEELNGFEAGENVCADAISYLSSVPDGAYDLIVVDPPAFAKHRGALKNALRAYQRLNAAAIAKVAPGGFVFTFSCSQVVDRESFALMVFSAAASTGRSVRIMERLFQAPDHPVNIYHPEGEYLKGLLLYVD